MSAERQVSYPVTGPACWRPDSGAVYLGGPPSASAAVKALINALGLESTVSQLLFDEPWDDAAAWSLATAHGTVVGADGLLTLTATSGSGAVSAVYQDTDLSAETGPYVLECDITHIGNGTTRLLIRNGLLTDYRGYFDVSGTIVKIAGGDLATTTVTPTNFDAHERFRLRIVVVPANKTLHFYMLHKSSLGVDSYDYLGSKVWTGSTAPDSFTFSTGSAVTSFTVHPVQIWRSWGCVIGDSLATGSGEPGYSPVPGFIQDDPDSTGTLGYWVEQDQSTSKRVSNFGRGGQGTAFVAARDESWIVNSGCKLAIIWCGTNDIGVGTSLATMQGNAVDAITALRSAGVLPVWINTVPRPNYSTPAAMNAQRRAWNSWLAATLPTYDGLYVDADRVVRDPADPDGLITAYNEDDVHLTNAGYAAVAAQVMRTLRLARDY